MAFAPKPRARLSLFPARRRVLITTRQASLNATDRWLASPKGLSTLGQTQPATGPPDSYPDGTHTRRRRQACAKDHELHFDLQLLGERDGQDTPETRNRRVRRRSRGPGRAPIGREQVSEHVGGDTVIETRQREDPWVAVDLQLVDDLDLVEAGDPRESPQTLRREAPIDEIVARVRRAYTLPGW